MNGRTRSPFLHPVALSILVLSAAAAAIVQARAPWSARADWLGLWGLIGYGAAVMAARLSKVSRAVEAPGRAIPEPVILEGQAADLAPHMEEALRRLNNLAALGACGLAAQLPHTINQRRNGAVGAPTPLETARILRTVVVEGIEWLKPEAAAGGIPNEAEVLRYAILHEEYVLGRPNHQIMTRHNVSESTFHRYRRVGTRALAAEIARREQLLADGAGSA